MVFSDASEPVRTGRRFAAHLKGRPRPACVGASPVVGPAVLGAPMGVLKHDGLSPATAFDIGVGYGTFPLYRAFPDAFYHLIDPARNRSLTCTPVAALRCEIHAVALSDRDGEAAFEVRADIQESTLLEEWGRGGSVVSIACRCGVRPLFGGPIERPAL